MILIENITSLKHHFPNAWDKIKDFAEEEPKSVKVEPTKFQESTVAIHLKSGWNYIHSKYNPMQEAQRFVNSLEEIGDRHVLFYGVGLGYHIDLLIQKYPSMTFSIYEPNNEVFHRLLELRKLDEWSPSKRLKNVMVQTTEEDLGGYLSAFTNYLDQEVYVVILQSYERLYPDQTQAFVKLFREVVYEKRDNLIAGKIFAKRMAINGIVNLPTIIKTPNFLEGHGGRFAGKPAILVSAGPSLNDEYENLRYIKENKLAYIFSVGSSINSLLSQGIVPDAAFSYDGSVMNSKVFKNIIEQQMDQIPLIFGSTIGFETPQRYPGKMANFMVKNDYIMELFLKRSDGGSYTLIERFRSIATLTLQILHYVGYSPIILVGQNFAYRADQYYAQGIDYIKAELDEKKKENALPVTDVYGNETLSSRGHIAMRVEMEEFIRQIGREDIINTTKGGANIRGTKFATLESVIRDKLYSRGVVEENWFDHIQDSITYDYDHFNKSTQEMLDSYRNLEITFRRFTELMEEMDRYTSTKSIRQLEICFNKFDKLFDRLQRNKLNLRIIQAMNHLEFQLILKMFEEVRFHTDTIEKAKRVIKQFGAYVSNCTEDLIIVKTLLEEMREKVLRDTLAEKLEVK